MNISQPVASAVDGVDFTFLSAAEIKAISVRRIENDNTFDHMLNPTPGGLYDPALGSWTSWKCATCNLEQNACPGHPGHIELPVPLYHPVFMDQIYRLLRAQCICCHGFRLRRRDLHRFECMLRLLQYGLLHEAHMVDAIGENHSNLPLHGIPQPNVAPDSDDEDSPNADGVIGARDAYVRDVLQERHTSLGNLRKGKHEGAAEMRRHLVKDLLKDILKTRVCATCNAISPAYRKDRFVKIFEKELSPKEKAKMKQGSFKRKDAVLLERKEEKKSRPYPSDEAIADLDSPSSEEEGAGEGESEGEGDDLDESGQLVGRVSNIKPAKGKKTVHPSQSYVSALEVRARLRLLFEKEQALLAVLYNSKPRGENATPVMADMFFLEAILVPPNRYRPEARTGDSKVTEAAQNSLYKMILGRCMRLREVHRQVLDPASQPVNANGPNGTRNVTELHEAWTDLQESVNALIDKNKNPIQGIAGRRNEDGIKQQLEKKEGLFRKNMMGKRVNYAARSVISPDPNIETNEIGVPPVFASKLTYPEPVTSHNFRDMKQAVINGPDKWPGAVSIETENGQIINLRKKSYDERLSLANQLLAPSDNSAAGLRNKKVLRHLTNGDVVLMNRQPTLHKPSIMGHRVKVLPGEKTIRMHYANCNTYNADFDGDEMNMHFPQNETARAEALQLADTDHQYISGTQGEPLRGLIQDHLSMSVALCNKDAFFDKGTYQQLIYGALRPESGHILTERIELVRPAIAKPLPRWTGKQVITTILKNIKPPDRGNIWMTGKCKIPSDSWGAGSEEGQVLFHDGDFISGILDKAHLGPSSGGLVHAVHEVYGPATAGKFLSSMGRLLTRYLNMRAFTCGMDDLKLTERGERVRSETIERARFIGINVAAKYVKLDGRTSSAEDPELLSRLEEAMRDDSKQEGLDTLMNKACHELSNSVRASCLPLGLEKQFPKNQMQSMTTSGAKGGPINATLISCNLGQQVLEGRRVPLMVSGKSLPCFRPFDTDVRAGGYVVNRFLTGIRPQEYYFHHMAGREGLIDTAVKTSRSGYLQRCLIKGMEGLKVAYDTTVRDADGSLIQFLYGEDGLDITKQKYLTDFNFLLHNFESMLAQTNIGDPSTHVVFETKDHLVKLMKKVLKRLKANAVTTEEPVSARTNPARHAYAMSEKFYEAMSKYIKGNEAGLIKEKGEGRRKWTPRSPIPRKTAEMMLVAKYVRSLVEPGEAVGIVAGQSVGEPSTQMTLNTFHLAGHSAKNVTLGIPRLREILMTASEHISTPSMTLLLHKELPAEDGERFAKAISRLPLSNVLDTAIVKERVGRGLGYSLARIFDVRLNMFPSSEYTGTYAVTVPDVLDTVERKFLPALQQLIAREIKKRRGQESTATPNIGTKTGMVEMAVARADVDNAQDEDDEDDNDEDGDATNAKQKANRSEAISYGPNDDDDDVIQRQMEREASPEDMEDRMEDEGFGGSPPPASDREEAEAGKERRTTTRESVSREDRIKANSSHVTQFRCNEDRGEWCEFTLEFDATIPKILLLNLLQDAARKSVVQQIPGVGVCTLQMDYNYKDPWTGKDKKVAAVHTAGANIRAMQRYSDFIDLNTLTTNDIAAVLRIYGVEACRGTIIQELAAVFGSHGISVDNRHLNLIGDYMTRSGGFTPFNRNGLVGNVSPFTKMSFETTLAFLKDAVLDGDWDDLSTPSGRLVMGKLGKVGTGGFDVLARVPQKHFNPLLIREASVSLID